MWGSSLASSTFFSGGEGSWNRGVFLVPVIQEHGGHAISPIWSEQPVQPGLLVELVEIEAACRSRDPRRSAVLLRGVWMTNRALLPSRERR